MISKVYLKSRIKNALPYLRWILLVWAGLVLGFILVFGNVLIVQIRFLLLASTTLLPFLFAYLLFRYAEFETYHEGSQALDKAPKDRRL